MTDFGIKLWSSAGVLGYNSSRSVYFHVDTVELSSYSVTSETGEVSIISTASSIRVWYGDTGSGINDRRVKFYIQPRIKTDGTVETPTLTYITLQVYQNDPNAWPWPRVEDTECYASKFTRGRSGNVDYGGLIINEGVEAFLDDVFALRTIQSGTATATAIPLYNTNFDDINVDTPQPPVNISFPPQDTPPLVFITNVPAPGVSLHGFEVDGNGKYIGAKVIAPFGADFYKFKNAFDQVSQGPLTFEYYLAVPSNAPSGEDYGVRLWSESGELTLDSGWNVPSILEVETIQPDHATVFLDIVGNSDSWIDHPAPLPITMPADFSEGNTGVCINNMLTIVGAALGRSGGDGYSDFGFTVAYGHFIEVDKTTGSVYCHVRTSAQLAHRYDHVIWHVSFLEDPQSVLIGSK